MGVSILLAFIIFLLIVPIPIKIKLSYENSNINLCLYGFKINLNKITNKLHKLKDKSKRKKCDKSRLEEDKKNKAIKLKDIPYLAGKINNLKYKPTLRLKIYLSYGLDDAYYTAVSYGYLNSLNPYLYKLLCIIFKIKLYKTNIKPELTSFKLETIIESIFSINIAKIIYITASIYKSYKNIKQTA